MAVKVLTKHQLAEDAYEEDFAADLGSGESLAGTPTVKVFRGASKEYDADDKRWKPIGPWTDVTSEFVTGAATLTGSNTKVKYTLKDRAAAGEQAAGTYLVRIECGTNVSDVVKVHTAELEVSDRAVG